MGRGGGGGRFVYLSVCLVHSPGFSEKEKEQSSDWVPVRDPRKENGGSSSSSVHPLDHIGTCFHLVFLSLLLPSAEVIHPFQIKSDRSAQFTLQNLSSTAAAVFSTHMIIIRSSLSYTEYVLYLVFTYSSSRPQLDSLWWSAIYNIIKQQCENQ